MTLFRLRKAYPPHWDRLSLLSFRTVGPIRRPPWHHRESACGGSASWGDRCGRHSGRCWNTHRQPLEPL